MKNIIFSAALIMADASTFGAAFANESVMRCLDSFYFKWEDGFFSDVNVYQYFPSIQEWRPLCAEGWELKISDTARAASCVKGGETHWKLNFELLLLMVGETSSPTNCEGVDGVD